MKLQLSDRDRQAVDLLLDRSPSVDGNGANMPQPAVAAGLELTDNLKNVAAVLNLLSNLPSEDPPLDLVQRTLQRIPERTTDSMDEFLPEESLSDSGSFTL